VKCFGTGKVGAVLLAFIGSTRLGALKRSPGEWGSHSERVVDVIQCRNRYGYGDGDDVSWWAGFIDDVVDDGWQGGKW